MASSQWVRVGWDKIFLNLPLRRELDECAFSPRSHVGAFQFSRIKMHFTNTIVSASLVHPVDAPHCPRKDVSPEVTSSLLCSSDNSRQIYTHLLRSSALRSALFTCAVRSGRSIG